METERLILRPLEEHDAKALHPLANDPDVAAGLLTVPHPYPEDQLLSWVRYAVQLTAEGERHEMSIILKETGLPIGTLRLRDISAIHLSAELGYWLGKPYWGQGYMTEAASRIIRFGFESLGLERIYACCFVDNHSSARVCEKVGMKYEGRGRREVRKDGKFIDLLHYAIIRSDLMG